MTFLLPLLLLGGVAIASQIFGGPDQKTPSAPGTPGTPGAAPPPPKDPEKEFARLIATLDTPTMQGFLRDVSGWVGDDFAKGKSAIVEAWKNKDSGKLRSMGDDVALYSMRPAPVVEKDGYGAERANLIQLAQLIYDRTKSATGEDRTRYGSKAALENVQWFQIMTDLTKYLPAPKTDAEIVERRNQYRAATKDWLSDDPKAHVDTALAIKSTLVMPLSEAQRARVQQAVQLETARAERLGASASDLAAIASTAMGAGSTGPVAMPPMPDPDASGGPVAIDVPGLETGPVSMDVPGVGI